MTTAEVISVLRAKNVRLEADGDDLRIVGPRSALTADLVERVKEQKAELLRVLRSRDEDAPDLEPVDGEDGEGPSGSAPEDPAPDAGLLGATGREPDESPLSFAQERMWFLDQMEPGSTAYNRPFAFRLRGPLDRDALEESIREIHRRQESLRTRFPVEDGEPVQDVAAADPALRFVDLSDVASDEREGRLREVLEEEARTPFDLAEGPLARYLAVRLGPREHAFLHTTHHSVSDGLSTGIFHRELEALYRSRTEGEPVELPDLPVDYRDYAVWQRKRLRGEELESQLDFWRERLGDEPPPLELPLDHPRPPVQSYRGAGRKEELPADHLDRMRGLARERGATPFMALFALYVVLLHRYSGQDDVTVGVPVAGRNQRGLEDLIGLFVNTLVLRIDLSGDPTFLELLDRVRERALEAYAHQDVPFEKVVEAIDPERTASHHPLFQVLFTFRNESDAALSLPGLDVASVEVERGATYMDLDLAVEAPDDGPGTLALRYNTDLFDEATAERLLGHYRTLLEGAVENPDRPVSELPILTGPERRRILEEWNDTDADLDPPRTVHEMVEAQARRTPDRVALVGGDEEVTYSGLLERAEGLARRLRAEGVGPGTTVGVATDRSPTMVASVLGVLKAGGAYLPLDPSMPEKRLAFMLEDAGTTVVVADGEGRAALPALDDVRLLDPSADAGGPEGDPDPAGPTPDDLAYVIYTSGSTGRPKGVEVPHRTVHNFLRSMEREPGLDADDVVLAATTLSFDISVLELFLPLSVGGRVVLADRQTARDGRALLEAIRRHGITLLQATPATWRLLLEAGWEGADDLRVLSGGEALPPDLARALAERSSEVWNLYGPTETTVWSARYRLPPDGEPVRIGRPIENTRLYVLDRAGQPVPVGVPGELYIGGAGVTRGYRDRPERTAGSFVPDPFSSDPDARLYRTGDRCRYRPDGTLEFLGRWDHQVKIRGFRIELGEIEAALADLEAVEEGVVSVLQDRAEDKRLVAYVTFREGRQATSSEIRRRLGDRLPDYMVPSLIVEMGSLPLTPSGKVDRNALPDPMGVRSRTGEDREEPSTPTEELVAGIWSHLLGVEEIGRRDNFFDLGGHSLLSMRAVHRIEERTGGRLNPRVLILNTLEQVAAEVDRATEEAA